MINDIKKIVLQLQEKYLAQVNIQSYLVFLPLENMPFQNIEILVPDWLILHAQQDFQKEENQELQDPVTIQEKNKACTRLVNISSPGLKIVNVEHLVSHREILGGLKHVEVTQDLVIIVYLLTLDIMNQRMLKEWQKHHIWEKDLEEVQSVHSDP